MCRDMPAADNLGALHLSVHSKDKAGSCNFCTCTSYQQVVQVAAQGTMVRLCHSCMTELIRQYKEITRG